jgi:hypothetical protein
MGYDQHGQSALFSPEHLHSNRNRKRIGVVTIEVPAFLFLGVSAFEPWSYSYFKEFLTPNAGGEPPPKA